MKEEDFPWGGKVYAFTREIIIRVRTWLDLHPRGNRIVSYLLMLWLGVFAVCVPLSIFRFGTLAQIAGAIVNITSLIFPACILWTIIFLGEGCIRLSIRWIQDYQNSRH